MSAKKSEGQFIETRCAKCKKPFNLADLQWSTKDGLLICESCNKKLKKGKK